MIIINGAGSQLAQNFIQANLDKEILTISRESKLSFKNVTSINLSSNDTLHSFLEEIDTEKIVWLNFTKEK